MKKMSHKEILAALKGQNKKEMVKGAKEEAKKSASGGGSRYLALPDGIEWFKPPKDKKTHIDIVGFLVEKGGPLVNDRKPGSLWWRAKFKIHRNVGPEELYVVCPGSIGKKCPICEHWNILKQDEDTKKEAEALKPSWRDLMWVVEDGDLKLFEFSNWNFGKKIDLELQDVEGEELFYDPRDNVSLQVRWATEKKGGYEVTEASSVVFVPRKGELDEEAVGTAMANDPSTFLVVKSYNELKALFEGEDLPEEEEEAPAPKKRQPEPEEEEEDTPPPKKRKPEPEPEEEEEEPAPKRKKPSREEEDEEEPPAKSKKKGDCPHGHAFGKDTDKKEECDDCPVWDACYDAKNG